MNRHVLCILLSALLGMIAPAARGQEMERIHDVTALNGKEAGTSPRMVKLRGVVTEVGVEKKSFTINDGAEGIGVVLSSGIACPTLSDDVEVEGKTMNFTVAGFSHPRVLADAVRVVSKGKLPEPTKLTLAELNSFKHFERWVSVEGFVLRWKFCPSTNEVTGCIAGDTTWTTFTLRANGRPEWLSKLMRAKVRLTGINAGVNTHNAFGALIVPSPAQLEILTPGGGSAFDAPLVSIKEVNARTLEPGMRVKVRGVVAAQNNFQVYLRGDGGAQFNALQSPWERQPESRDELADTGPWPVLSPGDEVEFVGSSSVLPYALNFGDVRVIGKGSIAPPEKVDLDTMKAGRYTDNWITLEARVFCWSRSGDLIIYNVWGPHGYVTIHVPTPVTEAFPSDLHGAKVRFTGVAVHRNSVTSYYIPSPAHFEVLEPGTEDPFAVPEGNPADIASDRVPLGVPTKITGQVIGFAPPFTIFLRSADTALRVKLQPTWGSSRGTPFADYGPPPSPKRGDKLEVMGWPIRAENDVAFAGYDLVCCAARVLGHEDPQPPVATTLTRIAKGEHTNELVEVRGRLLTWQVAPLGAGEWRTTMLLKGDGTKLTFVHESGVLHPFDTLKPTDDVLLQAVVERATEQTPRRLRLLSPTDAKSLGLSSEIINNRFWIYGGGGLALLALFSGWIVALRRSNRSKTEGAALLEHKVNERTSELRQAQTDLSKALEQERELGELKSRFVATVSHEFRTPLGVTMSAVEIMRHFDAKLTPERRQELCNEIHDATRGMADLMEQVLMLGRVEAGKLGFRPVLFDFAGLAGKLIDESLSATSRRCQIVLHCEPGLKEVRGDEALIRHILGNLITNAVKYSPNGSTVLMRIRRDGNDVVCEVEDHGIGIPEIDRPHLFEAFHRATNVGDIPGTGLGLVIVKRCVDIHSGSIDVQSEVGKGTTFIVRLPVFGF
ncbi:MAG: HAMP domain-containing sensor histidine kinase [Verrucomicrobia bacterium]|nr:HAMP domain-containing sensor histidine kinase [Verrucomicrobiota bacterium]